MRGQLQRLQRNGRPLSEWKRAFVLSPELRPCRNNVIEFDYVRGKYDNDWFTQSTMRAPDAVFSENRSVVDRFLTRLQLEPIAANRPPESAQQHRRALASLREVVDEVLVPFRVTGAADSSNLIGAMLQLAAALDSALANGREETCAVYEMSHGYRRERTVNSDGRSPLFQGPTRTLGGGYSYPGDAVFHDEDVVSVQIYRVTLFERRGENRDRVLVAEDVPVLAVWVPHRLAVHWIAQHQSNRP